MTAGWDTGASGSGPASGSGSGTADYTPSTDGKYAVAGYDANGYKIQTGSTKEGKAPALLDAALLQPIGPSLGAASTKSSIGPDRGNDKGKGKDKAPAHGLGAARRETVVRSVGGRKWEDPTLIDWDPSE
jgi:hypothetical protein